MFKEVSTIRGGSVGGSAGDDREETKRNTRGERGRPSAGRGRSQRASSEKENVGSMRTGDMSSDLEGVSVRAMGEEDGKEADDAAALADGAPPPAYEITECGEAVAVPTVKLDPLKENPRLGVGMMTWSSCSKYIVSSTPLTAASAIDGVMIVHSDPTVHRSTFTVSRERCTVTDPVVRRVVIR